MRFHKPLTKRETKLVSILDRVYPTEQLPFGVRWRVAGSYLSQDTDTSRSLLKRGLPWFKDCGVYLHRIDRADEDRHCHNHPYNFGSLILSGGYCQAVWTPDGVKNQWFKPLQWSHMPRSLFHRVQYLPDWKCWTLFFAGKPHWMPDGKTHKWGFVVDGQFVDWLTYRKRFGHNV